ncbi:hypothetical protein [Rufibacter sp. LB8]|uniref:hypothetical protein n=1 Tax=Rufibacter sp. LB8 TaxID=2777781 RepID=UPI00178C620D|nr:hypothetical protein [Rufibacter sp. LB8]
MLVLLLVFIGLSGYIVFDVVLEHESRLYTFLRFAYIAVTVITYLFFSLTSFSSYEPLLGRFNGTVELNDHGISVKNKLLSFADISKVDFHVTDYKGRRLGSPSRMRLEPALSQGTGNFISIKTIHSGEFIYYFQLTSKDHVQQLFPFLQQLVTLGKMSSTRAAEIMKNSSAAWNWVLYGLAGVAGMVGEGES